MAQVEKYGLLWDTDTYLLDIERFMILGGGQWVKDGKIVGEGLFHHYREMQKILWPDEDHHRWTDLILKHTVAERLVMVMGSKDSGKTHCALARFGLTEYWVDPDHTLIFVSSTDTRGLEQRVWGDIKDLFSRARALHPQLAGNVIDHKFGIFTDTLAERGDVRDMRKGIICIPCLGSQGQWVGGIEKFIGIKQKRRRLLGDELSFMKDAWRVALANLDKGDFKCVGVGHPIGQGDPLDKIAEPVAGWDSLGEITKTTVWRNKFDGITINLVGTDSPNFDPETKNKYPYLLDEKDVARVASRYGRDSMEFWSQIMGVRKAGLFAHRVLTKEICEANGAFKEVIWQGGKLTSIYACDAAFGGDRCVGGKCDFGQEVGTGKMVIKLYPPRVIPIAITPTVTPEQQIAMAIKKDCDQMNIPAENVFFDVGMWATAAIAISHLVGTSVNAINFQGAATERNVSEDEFIFDRKLNQRRLKKWSEHVSKFVTELWFRVRMVVECQQMREMPKDVAEEFSMREWIKVNGDRYEIETKDETKKRMGSSPDLADWCSILIEGCCQRGFKILREPAADGDKGNWDWFERLAEKQNRLAAANALDYRC